MAFFGIFSHQQSFFLDIFFPSCYCHSTMSPTTIMSQSTTISICEPAPQFSIAKPDGHTNAKPEPSYWRLVNTLLRVDVLLINLLLVLKLAMHWCSTSDRPSKRLSSPPPSCFPRADGTTACYQSHGSCALILPVLLIAFLLACMPVVKALADAPLPVLELQALTGRRRGFSTPTTERKTVRWAM